MKRQRFAALPCSGRNKIGEPGVAKRHGIPEEGKMIQPFRLLLPAAFLLALAGCNQPDAEAPGSNTAVPAESVDTDPTPQTGTGGPSETASPDATVNGAPAAEPEQN
jgi:hypothetical protein